MANLLINFKQYWRKTVASINKSFSEQENTRQRQEALEREMLSLDTAYQTLVGKLEGMRAESERVGSEAFRKIATLEQSHQQTESARIEAAEKLAKLEQRLLEAANESQLEHQQIAALETALAESTRQLETRANQLKFLQDSAREQLQALKTALAETESRLETRDNEIRQLQDSAHEQITSLEIALTEAVSRFETIDGELRELQATKQEQAHQIDAFLASSSIQLAATTNQVMALEKKLDVERKLQQHQAEDTQALLRKQETRLRWALVVAVCALILAAVEGAFFFGGTH